ncbi:MAG TPA: riboflavin synthase [Polyangiaceae bacterium]|jgi:riboflavin synthase
MFTGLVAATGVLAGRVPSPRGPGARLVVRAAFAAVADEPLALGESITVDGACLSVTEALPDGFAVDATAETLARTTLGELAVGARVNLERALRAGDRLGGHLVSGHVDGVGRLEARTEVGEALGLTFALPAGLARYVAEKGSVALNGASMTVNAVRDVKAPPGNPGDPGDRGGASATFDVMVIPITRRETNLGDLAVGARVNVEVDQVARYVARILGRDHA